MNGLVRDLTVVYETADGGTVTVTGANGVNVQDSSWVDDIVGLFTGGLTGILPGGTPAITAPLPICGLRQAEPTARLTRWTLTGEPLFYSAAGRMNLLFSR